MFFFLYSQSYFDVRNESKIAIFIFELLFWRSHWVEECYFDIRTEFEKMLFWRSKSYFDIRTESKHVILILIILFDIRSES